MRMPFALDAFAKRLMQENRALESRPLCAVCSQDNAPSDRNECHILPDLRGNCHTSIGRSNLDS